MQKTQGMLDKKNSKCLRELGRMYKIWVVDKLWRSRDARKPSYKLLDSFGFSSVP